ncbi:MAG: hypothetical protein KBT34_13820 [Prevotella sp.]|nr:hypothetical protein [Candidatus Prevotella equi]
MKKINIIIILLLCSVAAVAQKSLPGSDQINPEIKKLMQRIDSLGVENEVIFDRDAKQGMRYRVEPWLYVETDDTIKQEGLKRIVDTNGKEHFVGDGILKPMAKNQADAIRKTWRDNRLAHEAIMKTIKRLAPESEMTNHYEVHKNGMDTIDVSMMLSKEKNEYLEYGLRSFRSRSDTYNLLRALPLFKYNCIVGDNSKAYKFIDVDDFMTKAKPIFDHKNVKSRKAVYEHDGDFRPENDNIFALRMYHVDGDAPYNSHTDATIYQCTSRKQAEEMLAQLISLIWQYTGEHKDVSYYEFQPFTRFTDWSTSVVIEFTSASKKKGAAPREFYIVLYKAKGKELYYFAFLNTDGDLWLPLDWATVEHSKLTNKPMEGNVAGTWKCSELTLRNLGLDYDKMSGKIELKGDSTFTMTAKGRGIGGYNFWPHRTVSVKLNGTYSIKCNSISFNLKRDNIKCHINDDAMDNDPKLDSTPAYKHQQEHTTWDAADRRYETAKDQGSMQEESLKDDIHKAMPFRANITFIDSKTVQIGSTIYLTR